MPLRTWRCRCLVEILISMISDADPGMGLLDQAVVLLLIFYEPSFCFPQSCIIARSPRLDPAVCRDALLSTSSPALVFVLLLVVIPTAVRCPLHVPGGSDHTGCPVQHGPRCGHCHYQHVHLVKVDVCWALGVGRWCSQVWVWRKGGLPKAKPKPGTSPTH